MKTLLIILLFTLTEFARAGVVTLTAQSNGETNGVAELTVGQYEVAEVISLPTAAPHLLYVLKDSKTILTRNSGDAPLWKFYDPIVVAGPAKIRLIATTVNGALCTVKVTPEAYPPDRAILVPPGTNQVQVLMECSTNLVNWFAATNGVYGPLPEAKFFRIKLEPVQ